MDQQPTKEYYKGLVKWETEVPKLGGQSCGITYYKTKLICEEVDFEISVNHHRSQLKNKQLMLTLFELYLDEILK
jgi:hypothetical protein